MPSPAAPGLLHATSFGWHDVLWGLAFTAAVALAYWAVHTWLRRRRAR